MPVYKLDLSREEIDYVIRRLREIDPGPARHVDYVANKIEDQIPHDVKWTNPRLNLAYQERFSYRDVS